jgi:hypothetical protein
VRSREKKHAPLYEFQVGTTCMDDQLLIPLYAHTQIQDRKYFELWHLTPAAFKEAESTGLILGGTTQLHLRGDDNGQSLELATLNIPQASKHSVPDSKLRWSDLSIAGNIFIQNASLGYPPHLH